MKKKRLTSLLVDTVLEFLDSAIRQGKEIKGIQICKKQKLSLFKDGMIFNVKIPKKSTKKLLKLVSELARSQDKKYRQKWFLFLHKSHTHLEIEIFLNTNYNRTKEKYLDMWVNFRTPRISLSCFAEVKMYLHGTDPHENIKCTA